MQTVASNATYTVGRSGRTWSLEVLREAVGAAQELVCARSLFVYANGSLQFNIGDIIGICDELACVDVAHGGVEVLASVRIVVASRWPVDCVITFAGVGTLDSNKSVTAGFRIDRLVIVDP